MSLFGAKDSTLERISRGRTDLVFEYVGDGRAATSKSGDTSLISMCAMYGDVSAIRFLLAHGERLESLGPNLGLSTSAYFGHWRLCAYLLEQGADPNHADANTGETPLHAALC